MAVRSIHPAEPLAPKVEEASSGPREHRFPYMGTLPEGAFYVERPADRILLEALGRGEYCHLLAPRQIGKSSLRLRLANKLRARGVLCASIDLTSIGTAATPDEWFFGLVEELSRRLDLPDPVPFWEAHRNAAPSRRFATYVRRILAEELSGKELVIVIDEIEAVKLANFSADDFFLTLREMYEAGRAGDPEMRRLSFCLIGVTTPDNLIHDKLVTPFNISRRVELHDFTRAEMETLATGLEDLGGSAAALLDAVHRWTDGHPYMTMRACAALLRRGSVTPGEEATLVDEIIREEFLTHPMEDPNLFYAAGRFEDPKFERPEALLGDKMLLLRRLLDGERIAANFDQRAQTELWLCGMAKGVEDGEGLWLRPRNRVYETVFDVAWLQKRGDRKYLAEALRKWLESGKKKDYLLRGEALGDALQRDPRLLTEEEREFLVSSAEDEVEHWKADANSYKRQWNIYVSISSSVAELSKTYRDLTTNSRDMSRSIARTCYLFGVPLLILTTLEIAANGFGWNTVPRAFTTLTLLAGGLLFSTQQKHFFPRVMQLTEKLAELSAAMPENGEVAQFFENGVTEFEDKMAARREQLQQFTAHASNSAPTPPPPP